MNTFPEIAISGNPVNPKQLVEPGTGGRVACAFFVAILGAVVAIFATYGVFLLFVLFYPLFAWHLHRVASARIHGSGVRVGPTQFPEIHRCVETFKARLALTRDVEVYIVEANIVNAAAVRYGKKNVVLLTDDLIHGCLASGNPQALSFVIAHELAHISLNHNGVFRAWMANSLKSLGRMDEYSADRVALHLSGDRNIAFQGLLLLTVGFAMLPYVNAESVVQQCREVAANKYSKTSERRMSHPLLLNRINRVLTA
jgi:Zn-dependent protease with chaperone function